ncbi:MAG: tyrosine--tRNA ligase [Thermodesulfobacteriota bacterium]|nr:tyrosine--tRNA ligase [Thermodesulfobacteriota bacterium]
MSSIIDILEERGFIEAMTHDEELRDLVAEKSVTCYIGFDPTASSLHVGSLVPIMSLAHMQKNGHRPIALMGGGTGLVGDPSGKTEMRKLITAEDVNENIKGIKKQLEHFIDFSKKTALLVNNADWLTGLEYITFLRDIGRHFSVNRMVKAESYRMRLESEEGLNFIEFNYMLLQAYDFLKLFNEYGCVLQMGGSDQWGNIVAGIDLIRRERNKQAYGLTFPLITTSSGAKMGKTAAGAIWLDPERTSPYEYYQYWVNTDDTDVPRFLCLFTFLPMEEIDGVRRLSGADLNNAKAVLAFEATRIAHGHEAAVSALNDSAVNFGRRQIPADLLPSSVIPRVDDTGGAAGGGNAPSSDMPSTELASGIPAFVLFHSTGLADSKGQARRLIKQGGAYINDRRVDSDDYRVSLEDMQDGKIVLRSGKKRYHTVIVTQG